MTSKIISSFFFVFLVVMISGCTNDKVPLRGKVTFKEDGSPLTSGMVCFEADAFLARGPLRSDGTYRVGSLKDQDGIRPGTYRVYILGAQSPPPPDAMGGGMNMARPASLIASKYANAETSGITVQVDSKTKEFNFEVEKP